MYNLYLMKVIMITVRVTEPSTFAVKMNQLFSMTDHP
jgi:hypothetical protein